MYLRVVIFRRAPSARKKRNAIAHKGIPIGSSEKKTTLVWPCIAVHVVTEQVSSSWKLQGDSPVGKGEFDHCLEILETLLFESLEILVQKPLS